MKNLPRWLGFFLSGLLLIMSLVFGLVERSHPQSSPSTDLPSFLYLCENRSTLPQGIAHTVESIISVTRDIGGNYTSPCQEVERRLPQVISLSLWRNNFDLRPLYFLPNLKELKLTLLFHSTNFSILGELPNLRC
jgi:hypothetical protein